RLAIGGGGVLEGEARRPGTVKADAGGAGRDFLRHAQHAAPQYATRRNRVTTMKTPTPAPPVALFTTRRNCATHGTAYWHCVPALSGACALNTIFAGPATVPGASSHCGCTCTSAHFAASGMQWLAASAGAC